MHQSSCAKAYAAKLGFALVLEEKQVFSTGSQNKAWQRFLAEEDALNYLALLPIPKVGHTNISLSTSLIRNF